MPSAHVDAVVRLNEDVPAQSLRCGSEGVVVSIWLSPGNFFYEVEFPGSGESFAVRALLRAEQLEVVK